MSTRTDIHRPSEIDPANYEYIELEYFGPSEEGADIAGDGWKYIEEHMKQTGGEYANHEHGGSCQVCGASAFYLATFYHAETNSYIRAGQSCTFKMGATVKGAFTRIRKMVKNAKDFATGRAKAEKALADKNLSRAWEIFNAEYEGAAPNEESIIRDIVTKLIRYGSLSEKQFAFVAKLFEKIDTRPEREAKRAAEDAAAEDCPEGRIEITGEVLTTKSEDSAYGMTYKMLVRDDRGFKVWGTVPSSLDFNLDYGWRVSFTAAVTPSGDDPKFGFYKRPTKATAKKGEAK